MTRSSATVFDRLQDFGNRFGARSGAQIAFAVNTHADGVGVHIAFSNHEHRMDFHLFGALDFAVYLVGALVDLRADFVSAQLVQNRSSIIDYVWIITDGEDPHLVGRTPEQKTAAVMFDQETNEPFMRAERRAVNADRDIVDVITVFIAKTKISRLREIHLVRGECELASDHAPDLHVDFRAVKRRFVRHLDVFNPGTLQDI